MADARVILVMNAAFGQPQELPVDLQSIGAEVLSF